MPRGGRRQGVPGKPYNNRSDLRALPVTTAPGQQYGQRAAQEAAQQAVPMGKPVTPPASAAGASASSAPVAGPAGPLPGQVTPLGAPTERPGEPVTAGLPMGAGPGPEVLGMAPQQQGEDLTDILPYLPMLEFMASQPGASSQTRNFVRRLRAAKPVGQ